MIDELLTEIRKYYNYDCLSGASFICRYKLLPILQLLSSLGNIKIHNCRFLYRAQELIEYKILINNVEFIVLDQGFRYKRGIFGSHR